MKMKLTIGLMLVGIAIFGFRSAKDRFYSRPDFSGTWKLNLDNSENGGGAPVTMHVIQAHDSMIIQRVTADRQFFFERLSFDGKPCVCQTTSKRRKTGVANWDAADKTLTETGTLSDVQDLDKTAFDFVENWQLSADGKELTLESKVKRADGQEFTITAVYDKG